MPVTKVKLQEAYLECSKTVLEPWYEFEII